MPPPLLKINKIVPSRSRALRVESLEDRTLLTATVGVYTPGPNYHVLEGSPAAFYIAMSEPVQAMVTVGYHTVGGSATQDVDYQGRSGTVTIPFGDTGQNGVPVSTIADSIVDDGETFSLVIDSVSGGVGISSSSATAIIDDGPPTGGGGTGGGGTGGDGTGGGGTGGGGTGGGGTGFPPIYDPNYNFSVVQLNGAVEGISQGRFRISRAMPSGAPSVTVYFQFAASSQAIMNNSAGTVPNADYAPSTFPYQVKFATGQWESIIYIGAYADGVVETPESVTLELLTYAAPGQGPVSYVIDPTNSSATLSISDPPLVSVGNASIVEGDTGNQNVTVPVTLGFAVGADVSVQVQTTDGTALENNQDYVGGTKTVVIPAGQTQPTTPLTYQVNGDKKAEADEKFTAKILSAGPCRIDSANLAEITIQNDDYAPDLAGIPTTPYAWSEGQEINLNIPSVDNDTPGLNVTYTIAGTPPGTLRIFGTSQGFLLSGRINFLAWDNSPPGGYSMTVVATDPDGNSKTKTFAATVSDTSFTQLTATEVHFSDYGLGYSYDTSNTTTSTTPTLTAWTVSDQNWIRTTTATNPPNAQALGLIKSSDFQVVFEESAFATGTMTTMHRLSSASGSISLHLDLNLDGTFGPDSITQSILVNAATFSGAQIPHRRIANGPIEPTAYPLRHYERMEVSGTFSFELSGVTTNSTLFRYEMRNEGVIADDVAASGAGTSFTHQMSGSDAQFSSSTIRFYYDTNDNGKYDSDELDFAKQGIQIREASIITLNVSYSDAIANFDQKYAETAIILAGYMGLQRDSLTDFRSLIDFRIGTVNSFQAGGRDPITNYTDSGQFMSTLGTELIFVNDIAIPDAAGNDNGTLGLTTHALPSSVIEWDRTNASRLGNIILHEYGHQVGFYDLYAATDTWNIMYGAYVDARGFTDEQAIAFEHR